MAEPGWPAHVRTVYFQRGFRMVVMITPLPVVITRGSTRW